MADATTEQRLAALEEKVFGKAVHSPSTSTLDKDGLVDGKPWWEAIRGMYKDDPDYEEAMRLGREWREAQRPTEDE